MPIDTATDASLIGGIAALITGAGIAIRQLRNALNNDAAVSAQDKANKTLFEMLETKLQSQHEELMSLRLENESLRKELREVHNELMDMRYKFEECINKYANSQSQGTN